MTPATAVPTASSVRTCSPRRWGVDQSREQGRMGKPVRHFKGRFSKAEGIVVGVHT
jgi:hypothetical protein